MVQKIIPSAALAAERRTLASRPQARAAISLEPTIAVVEVPETHRASPEELARAIVEEMERERTTLFATEVSAAREAARAEGHAQGHAEGVEAGHAEGLAKAAEASHAAERERIERFDALLAAIEVAHREAIESTEDGAVAIAFAATCKILGERMVSMEATRAMVQEALRQAHADGRVVVRIAPGDFEQVDVVRQGTRAVEFVSDPAVGIGGCIVETTAGTLDARLEGQLARLREVLMRARPAAKVPA